MRLTRPLSRTVIAGAVALGLAGAGGAVAAVTQLTGNGHGGATPTAAAANATAPSVTIAGLRHGHVPWNKRLTLAASDGAFDSIRVFERDGTLVDGTLSSDGTTWRSDQRLVPLSHYRATVVLASAEGNIDRSLRFRATDSHKHLTAVLSPGDGDVVGVGSPVIVRLSRPVRDSQRAVIEKRLAVSTTPSVIGAWHWMTPQELHWRPPTYWKAHTRVTVTSDLSRLYLGKGVWGEGAHQVNFKIGDSHISRVDVARHQMYVYQNRHLIRTFPISAGRTQYPTKNGVHITFEKSQVVTMDSATVGIPRNSPDGYYEQVYWDVRISYGGAFVHAAPWSVAEQGISNVSHGCVNISPDNAIWFYNWSYRGDIVDVYNSTAPVDQADPGMADWNMTWKQWVAGDAAPTTTAKLARPPLPHDTDPGLYAAPHTSRSSSNYATHSHSASPSPSPTPSARSTSKPHHTGAHHHH